MLWLIGLAIIASSLFLPIGFCAIYRQADSGVWVIVGPLRFRVYPANKKKEKSKTQESGKIETHSSKGGSYRNFQPVVSTIIEFLGEFRRKIRVRRLELKLILAGDDPSDLAVNYGRAWGALGSLMPQLERLFVIKKRDLEVECDFTAEETLIYGRIDATISILKTLHLLSRHGVKILKHLLELKKLRKGGARL